MKMGSSLHSAHHLILRYVPDLLQMYFHLDTHFYLHQVKSSELTEELYTENIWKESGDISKLPQN